MPNDEGGVGIFIYSLSVSKHPKCNIDWLSQIQTLEKNTMMQKPNDAEQRLKQEAARGVLKSHAGLLAVLTFKPRHRSPGYDLERVLPPSKRYHF